MAARTTTQRPARLTARGEATRARILDAAADLMHARGVNTTSFDEVRVASGTSKSQIYQHFPDKVALVREVAILQVERVLAREHQLLDRVSSFKGLTRWRDATVQTNRLASGSYGCVLSSMANELSGQDDEARKVLAAGFVRWEGLFSEALRRMQQNGTLRPDAEPDRLAAGLCVALQGGYLLSKAAQDSYPMEVALDLALGQVRSMLVAGS